MNNFEEHLRQHKEAYDLEEVNPTIWKNIRTAEPSAVRRWLTYSPPWKQLAASIIFLLGLSLFWPKESPVQLSADLLYEYGFDVSKPQLVINAKTDELAAIPIPKAYAAEYQEMLRALLALDQRYAPVINNLKRTNAEEHTQRQALSYYRKKADLLNNLIQALQKLQYNEKQYPNALQPRSDAI